MPQRGIAVKAYPVIPHYADRKFGGSWFSGIDLVDRAEEFCPLARSARRRASRFIMISIASC
jgi:hypothetical protein